MDVVKTAFGGESGQYGLAVGVDVWRVFTAVAVDGGRVGAGDVRAWVGAGIGWAGATDPVGGGESTVCCGVDPVDGSTA